MGRITKKYTDLFNDIEEKFYKYADTNIGTIKINDYIKVTNAKPRNIYTSNNNFTERYLYESFILLLALRYINTVYDIDFNSILKEIPEIDQHFEWIIQLNKEIEFNSSIESEYEKNNFKEYLKFWLGKYFENIDKREYGEYYTPENLINLSLKKLKITLDKKVVDPACGSGFFLFAYVNQLVERLELNNINDINILKGNLYGFDIFPFPIIITKLLLGGFLVDKFGRFDNAFQFDNIKVHNTVSSLTCQSNQKPLNFDLVIGNPPFFRIKPDDKNAICNCISYGHNYIHSVFVHWSIQHLKENGELCLFLPQSILSGFYYQKLRNEILTKCSLDLIVSDKDHEKSFMVQQDIMILYLTKTEKVKPYYQIGTPNGDFTNIRTGKFSIDITDNYLRIIPVFKNENQYEALMRLSNNSIVDNLKSIQLQTGNFVWNQNKEIVLKDYEEEAIPLISGPNIVDGRIKLGQGTKFSYCIPDNEKYIKRENAILYRRMSPIGNSQRMVATVIDTKFIPEYVVENHVNAIICSACTISELKEIKEFITSKDFNNLMNAFCHTNQVSTNELRTIFEVLDSIRNNKELSEMNS